MGKGSRNSSAALQFPTASGTIVSLKPNQSGREAPLRNKWVFAKRVCLGSTFNPARNLDYDFPMNKFHATTILAVQRDGWVAIGGDGQVTLGQAVMKSDAVKIRKLQEGRVLCGFAGSSADAFSLMEKFEAKLKESPQNLPRAAIELAKLWRTDKILRQLEALLIATDGQHLLLVSGNGDVIQPTDGILGIGSGGNFAVAAARALVRHSSLGAAEIVQAALTVAGEICIYSNTQIVVEKLPCPTK